MFAQTLTPATTCSYYSFSQMWQTWAYSLVFVQLACWHTGVYRWSCGQPWRVSPFLCRKHCWCAHTSLPANFQCLHRVVLVCLCIICSLHLIAVWFSQAVWLPEWSLQLPSFLAFYVSKGRTGRSNTSLKMLCLHFAVTWSLPSTCHTQGDEIWGNLRFTLPLYPTYSLRAQIDAQTHTQMSTYLTLLLQHNG